MSSAIESMTVRYDIEEFLERLLGHHDTLGSPIDGLPEHWELKNLFVSQPHDGSIDAVTLNVVAKT